MIDVVISKATGVPFYRQIESALADQIRSGRLPEGTPLPSIRDLAKTLLVSVITTKQAYEGLEAEGLVVSVQGKGTFVAKVAKSAARESLRKEITTQLEVLVRRAHDAELDSDALQDAFARAVHKIYRDTVRTDSTARAVNTAPRGIK